MLVHDRKCEVEVSGVPVDEQNSKPKKLLPLRKLDDSTLSHI